MTPTCWRLSRTCCGALSGTHVFNSDTFGANHIQYFRQLVLLDRAIYLMPGVVFEGDNSEV